MRFHRTSSYITAAAAAICVAGCGGLVEQVQSSEIAIAALMRTPENKNPRTNETIPGVTTFTLFFGSIDKSKIIPKGTGGQDAEAGAFTGQAGATVSLAFKDAANADVVLNPQDKGDGKYTLDSTEAERLTYREGPYALTINWSGKSYKLTVEAPKAAQIEEFKTTKIITNHEAGAPFTVTRSGGSDDISKNDLAFVTLNSLAGAVESPSYSNAPTDALGFLKLVLDDSPWRAKSFTIPGANFKATSQYLVGMIAVKRGESDGPNDGTAALFPGSSFLAGVADAGGVLTQ